jgi:hypothetical protein
LAGNLAGAIPLDEKARVNGDRILGLDHPQMLDCRQNLATVFA